jgi:hypothetical protein
MKCGVCGHRANSIKGMGAHYRKKHPGKLKRHAKRDPVPRKVRRAFRREYGKEEGDRIMYATEAKRGIFHPHGCRCDGCK